MFILKQLCKFTIVSFLTLVSGFAMSNKETTLFQCSAVVPDKLSLILVTHLDAIKLSNFQLNNRKLEQTIKPDNFKLDSYHRALVDEKTLSFDTQGYSVLVSDYHSEELGEEISVLSVTLEKEGIKQYFECGEGSYSNL